MLPKGTCVEGLLLLVCEVILRWMEIRLLEMCLDGHIGMNSGLLPSLSCTSWPHQKVSSPSATCFCHRPQAMEASSQIETSEP